MKNLSDKQKSLLLELNQAYANQITYDTLCGFLPTPYDKVKLDVTGKTNTAKALERKGLVNFDGQSINLTSKGLKTLLAY
jgi:hypothetical protein